VLKNYKKELAVYRELYNNGKAMYEEQRVGLVISRGKPPVAGIISWAKSLMSRMKGPIVKFNKNEDKF
jgi:dynein heavy chain, axonemal